jgi:hypothetical protein
LLPSRRDSALQTASGGAVAAFAGTAGSARGASSMRGAGGGRAARASIPSAS